MLRVPLTVLVVLTALAPPVAAPLTAAEEDPAVEPLADGVFAVLQPAGRRFDDSNSLVVDLGDGLLVVDAQASLAATRRTIEAIRKRSEKPVRYLVLSHWHGDHVQGIPAYREAWPGVAVLAHASVREDILERAEPALRDEIDAYRAAIRGAQAKLDAGVGLDDEPLDAAGREDLAGRIARAEERLAEREALPSPLAAPDLAYDGALTFHGATRRATLLHLRAHTRGDTLVHLPDDRILATGDVVDDLPFGGHGYPTSWIEGLRAVEPLEFDRIVPGHGAVRGRDHFVLVCEMTESLVEQVRDSVAAGRDLEATVAALDLATYREALAVDEASEAAWEAFIPATAERAWLEARDELAD